MENLEQTDNKESKKAYRMSSSGRVVKTPKRILTTSSDEAPARKKKSSKTMISVKKELERLKKKYGNKDNSIVTIKESTVLLEKENVVSSNTSPQNMRSTVTDTMEKAS